MMFVYLLAMDVAMELARPLVQFLANRRLQEGFLLPMVDGVNITATELKLIPHAVQLGLDLIYQP